MMKALINSVLLSFILFFSAAQYGLAQEEPENLDALREAIAKIIETKNVPSAALALVDENGVQLIEAFGYARLESQMPATPETLYRIGSTSKIFVGLAVLKLVEEGRLSLDASLQDLAPEIAFDNPWENEYPIKIVHLLEHTTGWDDMHFIEYAHNEAQPIGLREGLAFHPHSRKSRWVPGTRMAYCNSGPAVAAYVVEKVTGKRFEDYVQATFFEPLDMHGVTWFNDENYQRLGATLYRSDRSLENYWNIIMRPSGALNASVRDMAQVLRFFIQRGRIGDEQILSEASLERMERPGDHLGAREGLELGYGLTNYSSAYDVWQYREHNGAVNNGLSAFAYLPQARAGYVLLLNSGDVSAQNEISRLIRKFQVRELTKPQVEKVRELSAEQRKLAGYYSAINPRSQMSNGISRLFSVFRVSFTEDKMQIDPVFGNWTAWHYPVSETLFKSDYSGAMHVAVVQDPLAGQVLHMEGTVLKPLSGFLVFGRLLILFLWSVIVLSSFVYLIVWALLKARKHPAAALPLTTHLMPLIASLCILLIFIVTITAVGAALGNLGRPSFYSVSLLALTVLYPLFAFASVAGFIKGLRARLSKMLLFYFGLACLLHLAVAIYMLRYDYFALMTWA